MNKQLLQQFRREAEAWKRTLAFLQSENAYLKTRIAEIAADNLSSEQLVRIENFQNCFIIKDELLSTTRSQVIAFQNQLDTENAESIDQGAIAGSYERIRDYIETLELSFKKLKADFNYYLKQKL